MWRKIRSSLILKKIMNNIENKIKFNLILYNKSIQKKLGLDLNDFRRFSGRYKIEESGIINLDKAEMTKGEKSNAQGRAKGIQCRV